MKVNVTLFEVTIKSMGVLRAKEVTFSLVSVFSALHNKDAEKNKHINMDFNTIDFLFSIGLISLQI